MTPEMVGKQENTNQKRRMELTLDLINARVSLTGKQRNQIREILREKFASAIEEEREACAKIAEEGIAPITEDHQCEAPTVNKCSYCAAHQTIAKLIRARSL